jgi:hypothetical protein
MKLIKLDIQSNNYLYYFEPVLGALLRKRSENQKPKTTNHDVKKVKTCLACCTNPYLLKKTSVQLHPSNSCFFLIWYVKSLVWLCKYSFLIGRIWSRLGFGYFVTSEEAIQFFRKCFSGSIQNDLCYPRTLFAASMSKKFKENGVIFIGVFLPSNTMHAWIIEDGKIADPYDGIWLNFQPVAALYYE